jgi:hypothetical protein
MMAVAIRGNQDLGGRFALEWRYAAKCAGFE